jgi:hypothetical protein
LQRWGLDLLGPLPPAQGNLRYVVVAVEYFSKWIEAKPLATITSITVQKFFWQNIVCRFGVPKAITVDNGVTPQCHLGFLSNAKPRTIISCESSKHEHQINLSKK